MSCTIGVLANGRLNDTYTLLPPAPIVARPAISSSWNTTRSLKVTRPQNVTHFTNVTASSNRVCTFTTREESVELTVWKKRFPSETILHEPTTPHENEFSRAVIRLSRRESFFTIFSNTPVSVTPDHHDPSVIRDRLDI